MKEENNYRDKCWYIQQYGGILFLIERMDNNEFLQMALHLQRTDRPRKSPYRWGKDVTQPFLVSFLTKDDAKKFIECNHIGKELCACCGSEVNSYKIEITEHEFVNQ